MKRFSKTRFVTMRALFFAGLIGMATLAHAQTSKACSAHVSGAFSSTMLPAEWCDSPVGLCTEGDLGGDLEGEYDFTATQMIPLYPAEDPYVFMVIGESVIYTDEGELHSVDIGTMNNATGELRNMIHIVDGTDEWEGASGFLSVTGTLNPETFAIEGDYNGFVHRR